MFESIKKLKGSSQNMGTYFSLSNKNYNEMDTKSLTF